MPRILVTGSLAYDHIMHFSDIFSRHILPSQLHILNVSFTAESMNKNFGGTAGNISYSLKLLQESPILFATAGRDFGEYSRWLESHGIDTSEVQILGKEWTASAHIITDQENNQITAFHGGAMLHNDISISSIAEKYDISFAIIAADGKQGMLRHAKELTQHKIPYIYDPGHSIPSFEGREMLQLVNNAHTLIVNKYELELLCQKTDISLQELIDRLRYVIVTEGEAGSTIYFQQEKFAIPVAETNQVCDPTGAGDAYRGGLLKGLVHGKSPEVIGRLASLAACYAVECYGTQNYSYSIADFRKRYEEIYGKEDALAEIF